MPGPQGFPDFQRLVQAVTTTVVDEQTVPVAGPITQGPYYVGAAASIYAFLRTAGAAGRVAWQLSFFNDQALTDFVAERRFGTDLSAVHVSMPVIGLWLLVSITPPDAVARTFDLRTLGSSGSAFPSVWGIQDEAALRDGGVVIAPAASLVVASPITAPGVATFTVSANQGPFKVLVEQELANGAWYPVAAGNTTTDRLTLPGFGVTGNPTRITITNQNAANISVAYAFVYEQ